MIKWALNSARSGLYLNNRGMIMWWGMYDADESPDFFAPVCGKINTCVRVYMCWYQIWSCQDRRDSVWCICVDMCCCVLLYVAVCCLYNLLWVASQKSSMSNLTYERGMSHMNGWRRTNESACLYVTRLIGMCDMTHSHNMSYGYLIETLSRFRNEDLQMFRPCWYLRIDNFVAQKISLCYFQKVIYKLVACFILLYRVLYRLGIYSSLWRACLMDASCNECEYVMPHICTRHAAHIFTRYE
jgi:hypothetical protein